MLERHIGDVERDYGLEADPEGSLELLVISDSVDPVYRPKPGEAVPVLTAILDLLEPADSRSQHLARHWLAVDADAVNEQLAKGDSGE